MHFSRGNRGVRHGAAQVRIQDREHMSRGSRKSTVDRFSWRVRPPLPPPVHRPTPIRGPTGANLEVTPPVLFKVLGGIGTLVQYGNTTACCSQEQLLRRRPAYYRLCSLEATRDPERRTRPKDAAMTPMSVLEPARGDPRSSRPQRSRFPQIQERRDFNSKALSTRVEAWHADGIPDARLISPASSLR